MDSVCPRTKTGFNHESAQPRKRSIIARPFSSREGERERGREGERERGREGERERGREGERERGREGERERGRERARSGHETTSELAKASIIIHCWWENNSCSF